MTDWWGLLDTDAAAEAGLDLEMPGPSRDSGPRSPTRYDVVVSPRTRRCDRRPDCCGVFAASGRRGTTWTLASGADDGTAHSELDSARSLSAASMVLVKNDRESATAGARAGRSRRSRRAECHSGHIMGGGSSQVRAAHRREPLLAALRRRSGSSHRDRLRARSPRTGQPTPLEPWELTNSRGEPGLLVEYFGNSDFAGDPVAIHHGDDFRMQYLGPAGPGIPYPDFCGSGLGHVHRDRRPDATSSCSDRTLSLDCWSTVEPSTILVERMAARTGSVRPRAPLAGRSGRG